MTSATRPHFRSSLIPRLQPSAHNALRPHPLRQRHLHTAPRCVLRPPLRTEPNCRAPGRESTARAFAECAAAHRQRARRPHSTLTATPQHPPAPHHVPHPCETWVCGCAFWGSLASPAIAGPSESSLSNARLGPPEPACGRAVPSHAGLMAACAAPGNRSTTTVPLARRMARCAAGLALLGPELEPWPAVRNVVPGAGRTCEVQEAFAKARVAQPPVLVPSQAPRAGPAAAYRRARIDPACAA
jgi:hypothetical protein